MPTGYRRKEKDCQRGKQWTLSRFGNFSDTQWFPLSTCGVYLFCHLFFPQNHLHRTVRWQNTLNCHSQTDVCGFPLSVKAFWVLGERVKCTVAQIPWGVWDEAVCLQPLVNNVRKRREVNAKIFSFLFALTATANQKSFAISPPPLASHIHFTIGHRQGLLGYLMSKTRVINKCQGELMLCFWKDLAHSRALGRRPGICRIQNKVTTAPNEKLSIILLCAMQRVNIYFCKWKILLIQKAWVHECERAREDQKSFLSFIRTPFYSHLQKPVPSILYRNKFYSSQIKNESLVSPMRII